MTPSDLQEILEQHEARLALLERLLRKRQSHDWASTAKDPDELYAHRRDVIVRIVQKEPGLSFADLHLRFLAESPVHLGTRPLRKWVHEIVRRGELRMEHEYLGRKGNRTRFYPPVAAGDGSPDSNAVRN